MDELLLVNGSSVVDVEHEQCAEAQQKQDKNRHFYLQGNDDCYDVKCNAGISMHHFTPLILL